MKIITYRSQPKHQQHDRDGNQDAGQDAHGGYLTVNVCSALDPRSTHRPMLPMVKSKRGVTTNGTKSYANDVWWYAVPHPRAGRSPASRMWKRLLGLI